MSHLYSVPDRNNLHEHPYASLARRTLLIDFLGVAYGVARADATFHAPGMRPILRPRPVMSLAIPRLVHRLGDEPTIFIGPVLLAA
jgi:hypothetical protein